MKAVENCENCGRVIGKLEQPYAWRKHVVCAECHARLSAPAPAAAASRPSQAPPPPPLPAREHFHARKPVPARDGPAPPPVDLRPPAAVAPQAAADAPVRHLRPRLPVRRRRQRPRQGDLPDMRPQRRRPEGALRRPRPPALPR